VKPTTWREIVAHPFTWVLCAVAAGSTATVLLVVLR
jgi:hypothetical protein